MIHLIGSTTELQWRSSSFYRNVTLWLAVNDWQICIFYADGVAHGVLAVDEINSGCPTMCNTRILGQWFVGEECCVISWLCCIRLSAFSCGHQREKTSGPFMINRCLPSEHQQPQQCYVKRLTFKFPMILRDPVSFHKHITQKELFYLFWSNED